MIFENENLINFDQLDKILQKLKTLLINEAESRNIEILDEKMWRHNTPHYHLGWLDQVAKNVGIILDPIDNSIKVECNAWVDISMGNTISRKWNHYESGKWKNMNDTREIKRIFDMVSSWTFNDLKKLVVTKR